MDDQPGSSSGRSLWEQMVDEFAGWQAGRPVPLFGPWERASTADRVGAISQGCKLVASGVMSFVVLDWLIIRWGVEEAIRQHMETLKPDVAERDAARRTLRQQGVEVRAWRSGGDWTTDHLVALAAAVEAIVADGSVAA